MVQSNDIVDYYTESYDEENRLARGLGQLELARSREIISRYLPSPPAMVGDIGGGPGVYSRWLAGGGYDVHLVDPVMKHLEQAKAAEASSSGRRIEKYICGDARSMEQDDETYDALLLLGPMYHIVAAKERVQALAEAFRTLKPGGTMLVAGINRFASLVDGLVNGYIDDPYFVSVLERDLADGVHQNPKNHPQYFTTAYFHRPEELQGEVVQAGFNLIGTFAIEGPAVFLDDFAERWGDSQKREQLLHLIRRVEQETTLMAASYHFMVVGRKQQGRYRG